MLGALRRKAARVHSFPPIEGKDAEVLVLGSMPGQASLRAGQYFAHPRNAFWRVIAELLQFDPALQYPARIKQLEAARIALWDVLQSCEREGSLDSSIERGSQVPNDFRAFFRKHPSIKRVFFNGAEAQACFNRHALGQASAGRVTYQRLPSTSPAHASLSFKQKLRAWRVILDT